MDATDSGDREGEEFVSFVCPSCRQEIEAPVSLSGRQGECPSCGAKVMIPAASGGAVFTDDPGPTEAQRAAMKSRTIRIELDDL